MTNRLSLAAAVLIGLALVPTLIHSYLDAKIEDGYTATAVGQRLAGLNSTTTDRRAGWVKKTFDSDDWSERTYQKPGGGDVRLFVARAYDLKRLYHHPELAVAYGFDLQEAGTQRLTDLANVPVHVLRGRDEQGSNLALYALLYGSEFVDNPYTFQLRTAGTLLFSPRRPMTLFFAHDQTGGDGARVDGTAAAEVLVAAIRSFESQTPRASE